MNLEYILLAAESYVRDGKKAEAAGHTDAAKQYYLKAAKKFKQAAEICPERAREFLNMAAKLEGGRVSAPVQSPTQTPVQNPQTSVGGVTSGQVGKNVQNKTGDGDYSGYDLNITKPNSDLTFDDLIGMEEAKDSIHKSLIYPLQNPEFFKKYKLDIGGFILLYGPPGTGKTFFAKVTASAVSVPFINVDCTGLVDSLIGKTAKNIDELFTKVRTFIEEQNTPVIMFLDEIDSLAKSRSSNNKTAEEAVPSLLRQLDGFGSDNSNISIIAATNVLDQLDSAVLSRFNNRIFVPLPDAAARKDLFSYGLAKHNVQAKDLADLDLDMIAEQSDGLSGRDITKIIDEFMRELAMRDSGISKQTCSLTELMLTMVGKRS